MQIGAFFIGRMEKDVPGILVILILLGPQVWAIAKAASAFHRMVSLSLSLVLLTALQLGPAQQILISRSAEGTGYHDTYYAVSHFHHFASLTVSASALAVLLAVTARWAAPLPRASTHLASLYSVCMAAMTLRPLWFSRVVERPRRYEEYEAYMAKLIIFDTYSAILTALIFWGFVALCLWRLLRRLNQWSKTG